MSTLLTTRTRRAILAWLVATLLVAAAVPVGAAGPPGNNGTVKIWSGAESAAPDIANEPHVVCSFQIRFFFADTGQQGTWEISAQPPGAAQTGTPGSSYDTGDGTSFVTEVVLLGPGHYQLSWQGRNETNVKHKTFWVDHPCD